jgi:hypothetical protein
LSAADMPLFCGEDLNFGAFSKYFSLGIKLIYFSQCTNNKNVATSSWNRTGAMTTVNFKQTRNRKL